MRKRVLLSSIIVIFIAAVFCSSSVVLASKGSGGKGKPGEHTMRSPIRLALTPEGNLLVSEYRSGIILTVDGKTLEVISWFQLDGRPLGVAYAKGCIYVGNETKERIEVYNGEGIKVDNVVFSRPILKPTDIGVDTEMDRIFVVDGVQKTVNVFSTGGEFLGSFPGANTSSQLVNPTGIAVNPAGKEVFVSDYGDSSQYIWPRIQIFDYNGNVVDTISGKEGMLGTRFSRPQGLAVDNSGHVFLVDCYSGEIMVFDRYNGNLLKKLGGYGTEPGQLRLPLDIVINPSSKDIYVTNNRAARVDIFEEGGVL